MIQTLNEFVVGELYKDLELDVEVKVVYVGDFVVIFKHIDSGYEMPTSRKCFHRFEKIQKT